MKNKIVISFFFNARGTDLEKSTIGMYQSLLLQLLQRFPKLQDVTLSFLETLGMNIRTTAEHLQFTINSLKYIFREAIHSLDRHSIVCFIDALDECSEDEVRDMISFFREVDEYGENLNEGLQFQVCFSSRHYPHISIDRGLSLVLEGQEEHNQDIADYVIDKLKIGNSKAAQNIRDLLREKASGVFMWVVLVVDILNKEHDRGRIMGLRNRLRDIPSDLHELFRDILRRDSSDSDRDVLLLCIQWVLFARQPLTPEQFYFAAERGHFAVVRLLIEKADVNIADINGRTPLSHAARNENSDIVELLLRKADPDIQDGLGRTPLSYAARTCNSTIVELLLKKADPDIKDVHGQTPLSHAVQTARGSTIVRSLLTKANPDLEDCWGRTPLSWAALGWNDSTVKLLLETANPNSRDHEGRTPLSHAAEKGSLNTIVKLLLERCDPNLEDHRYRTPLSYAARNGNDIIVKLLLEKVQIDFDIFTKAMSQAMAGGHFGIVKLLIDTIETHIKTNEISGDATLSFVTREAYNTVEEELVTNANSQGLLVFAATHGYDILVKLFLERNEVDVNVQNSIGMTALLSAAAHGHESTVKLLLDRNDVDVNERDFLSQCALFGAVRSQMTSIVELLLTIDDIDVNIPTTIGDTPFSFAAERGYKEVGRLLLLSNRVDPRIVEKYPDFTSTIRMHT